MIKLVFEPEESAHQVLRYFDHFRQGDCFVKDLSLTSQIIETFGEGRDARGRCGSNLTGMLCFGQELIDAFGSPSMLWRATGSGFVAG